MSNQPKLSRLNPDNDEAEIILDGSADDMTGLGGDLDAQLAAITSEFDADSQDEILRIKFHRVMALKGKRAWLFDALPSELPVMDRIRDEYGSGTYESSVFKNGRLHRKFQFDIETKKVSAITSGNSDMKAVLEAMAGMQQQMIAIMQSQRAVPIAPIADPFDQLTKMATVFKALQPVPAAPSNFDPMSMFNMFGKVIEVVKDLKGDSDGGGGSNLMDLARDLIKSPMLGQVLSAGMMAQRQIAPPVQRVPVAVPSAPSLNNSAPTSQVSEPAQPNEENMSLNNDQIAGYLGTLVSCAEQQKDSELYADFILDNVPPEMLMQYIVPDDALNKLTSMDSRINHHREWFESLRDGVVSGLTEMGYLANTQQTHAPEPNAPATTDGPASGQGGGTGNT